MFARNHFLDYRLKSPFGFPIHLRFAYVRVWWMRLDCEQSLFGQSRLSSAGLERANSRERGKRECEASESRGEAGEKAGKEGGTAFSFEPDVFR